MLLLIWFIIRLLTYSYSRVYFPISSSFHCWIIFFEACWCDRCSTVVIWWLSSLSFHMRCASLCCVCVAAFSKKHLIRFVLNWCDFVCGWLMCVCMCPQFAKSFIDFISPSFCCCITKCYALFMWRCSCSYNCWSWCYYVCFFVSVCSYG